MKNQLEYISILETRHPVETAGIFFPNDHRIGRKIADGTVSIEAVIRWGGEHGQTQRLSLITAHTGVRRRLLAPEYSAFVARAVPQLLTLWVEKYPTVPVAGADKFIPAPVVLPVRIA